MKLLVTVLIDTYNQERYIEQALVSVLEQDLPPRDIEIVVVDDGSTDRTPEIIQKFAPRVRLLRKKNGGQASAFNAGFSESHGQFVAFLDGDDWFATGKLAAVVKVLQEHPEVGAVGHGYYEVNEATNEVRICAAHEPRFLHLATPDASRRAYLDWRFFLTSNLTVRRRILHRVIPIPETLTFNADAPIAMASMAVGLQVIEKPLAYYRRHADNRWAVDSKDMVRVRRRDEMNERMFDVLEPLLIRLGVPSESIVSLLYPPWIDTSRSNLRTYGGSRVNVLRTEMRSFRSEFKNPSIRYRLFKYIVVGAMTLLLPPRGFYRMREWYGQRNLRRFRERLFKST
ncbi:MAG TPA: glycosyltransferase family A protein [Candidatus Acidoferrales bacterium]|nr:glycosyltransferase family A protein [Candidatus Acidoferrales bacterium]HEV3482001.1 glycosyltransferase family A protein [Candidatus Acidoferrales bacterium]